MVREWGTVVQASKVMLTFSGPCWALPDSIGGQVTMKWPSAKKALLTAAESCVSWVWHRAQGFDARRRSLRSMEAVPRVQLKLPRSPGIAARGLRRSSQVHLRNHPSSSARRASVTLLTSLKISFWLQFLLCPPFLIAMSMKSWICPSVPVCRVSWHLLCHKTIIACLALAT